MKIKEFRCANCIEKSDAVLLLQTEQLQTIEEGCLRIRFNKGELIVKEGAPASHIVYVREGFIKLFKNGAGDRDYVLKISKKGAFLNLQNLNPANTQYFCSGFALTEVKVCFIAIQSFLQLLKDNGTFACEVLVKILKDERNYCERLTNNLQQQLPGRLANAFLYFKNQVYNENPFNLNLTRSEVASLIGTSRESVSRMLIEFQRLGIIKADKNKITVLDENRLEEIKLKG